MQAPRDSSPTTCASSPRLSPISSSSPKTARLDTLAREAIAFLRRGRADLAGPLVDEMAALLPDRPDVAQQLQRIVAVVGFDWAARRGPARLATVAPPGPADVELVVFHVALDDPVKAAEYLELVKLSFRSARQQAPQARRVLLTDDATELAGLEEGVEVVRRAVHRERLMYERMRLQHEHLQARSDRTATVFLDSDIVVNAEPSGIFAEDFDVGLTYRPVVDAPFNGGVIFAAPGDGAERFYRAALACYDAMAEAPAVAALFPRDLRGWWGDQYALAALVGYRALAEREGDALEIEGARVRIFPCDTHNHTIESRPYAPGELASKRFIHFKGARKDQMARYLEKP